MLCLLCSGSVSLASLTKRKADSAAASAPRGRWRFHFGDESVDESLEVHYCAYCGAGALILDALVSELPQRGSDAARVVQLAKRHCKLMLDEGPCVKLKRAAGLVEKQWRYLCKSCGLPLAYLSHPFADTSANKYLYLIDGGLSLSMAGKTSDQLEAEEEQRKREEEELAAEPIIIPQFDIAKSAAATATSASNSNKSSGANAAPPSSSIAAATSNPSSSSSSSSSTDAASAPAQPDAVAATDRQ